MNKTVVWVVIGLVLIGWLFYTVTNNQPKVSGSLQLVGSTSVQPLAEELAQEFMASNQGIQIAVQGGGSGAGIKSAGDGTADIGMSSRELKAEEEGLFETVIARDGIAIVVNNENPVENLSFEELQKIYTGEYINWKQVGGPDLKIVVVNREAGSGTRGAFEEIVLGKSPNTNQSLVQASTGAVQQTVSVTKEAIGYISLGSLDPAAVKTVTIDGIECSSDNILAGKYKVQRPFLMLTKEEPTGAAKAFLDWITGPEGQEIVAEDFIPVK